MDLAGLRHSAETMTSRDDTDASMTAQYVRLSLFVLVVILGGAIVAATVRDGGELEGSISDYFHTPARLALVSVMLAIGVGLITLYSSNPIEKVRTGSAQTPSADAIGKP